MQKIIINTPKQGEEETTDWLETILIAQGVRKDGYVLNSSFTQIKASALPAKHIPALMKIVQHLATNSQLNEGKRCEAAEASLKTIPGEYGFSEEGTPLLSSSERAEVEVRIHWQWTDGRIESNLFTMNDEDVVSFVQHLLTPEAY